MAKRELIANDPMETKLMAFSETVNKVGRILIVVVLVAGVVLGVAASGVMLDFNVADLVAFLVGLLPSVIAAVLIWLAKELICLWLENQTEMHCYARTQTEIMMENEDKN